MHINLFKLFKIFLISISFFLFLDLTIGKYTYKKFIVKNLPDIDLKELSARDEIYDHKVATNYNSLVGWGDKRYKFCTDNNGFRISCDKKDKNLKNFDIAFIGDSFTEGTGYKYEETFVGLIERKLSNKKIANLGLSSYSPSIYLTKIKKLLNNGYKFKEIIVFVDISDLVDDTLCYKVIENTKVVRRITFPDCFKNLNIKNRKFNDFFEHNFKFSNILLNFIFKKNDLNNKKIQNQLKHSRSEWTYNYNKKNFNNSSFDDVSSLSINHMEKLYSLLNENSINLSVAVYPWPGTLKFDNEKNLQVKIWKKFCINKCSKFYNFMPQFFSEINNNDFYNSYKKIFIEGDIHFNEYGNRIIAENFILKYNE